MKPLSRENSFTSIRLILSILVLITHAATTSGHYYSFSIGIIGLGSLATYGFFAISGFLITPGILKWGFTKYLLRRISRIFPAFWGVSIVTVFLFARIWEIWGIGEISLSFSDTVFFLLNNILFLPGPPNSASSGWNLLQGLPTGVPLEGVVNGSIWSLPLEFMCYIAIGVLIYTLKKVATKYFYQIFISLILILWFISIYSSIRISEFWVDNPTPFTYIFGKWPYLLAFFIGSALSFQSSNFLKFKYKIFLFLIIVAFFSSFHTLTWALIGSAAFTAAIISLGSSKILNKISTKTDISYGIYLYHFPVQQTLVLFIHESRDRFLFILISLIVTGFFAYLSAKILEEPALKWVRAKAI